MGEYPKQNWDDLRAAGKGDGVLEVPSRSAKVETGYGPARFALGPAGELRLLVPCHGSTRLEGVRSTEKLSIGVVGYDLDGGRQKFIDLICGDGNLDAVFGELTSEVLKRLEDGEPPEAAVAGTIEEFRTLLFGGASAGVSKKEVVGVLGELVLLKRLSEHRADCGDAWLGPWEQRHDFRRLGKALEVKTSSRSDATKVFIHGIDQLRAPADGELVLAHLCMEPSAEGSIFVASLFDELVEAGVERRRLLEGLSELGCLDPRHEAWNDFRFEFESLSAWRVDSGFPRITAAELKAGNCPAGVSEFSYQIDLSVPTDFRLSESEFNSYLKELIS